MDCDEGDEHLKVRKILLDAIESLMMLLTMKNPIDLGKTFTLYLPNTRRSLPETVMLTLTLQVEGSESAPKLRLISGNRVDTSQPDTAQFTKDKLR